MKIYYRAWKDPLPHSIEYPCVVLTGNSWDDYGYHTTFDFSYYNDEGYDDFTFTHVNIKILQKGEKVTQIPREFEQLDQGFCSLGQSLEYYLQLSSLERPIYQNLLIALRDVVYDKLISEEFSSDEGFNRSLLRFSEAEKAYKEAAELFPELNRKNVEDDRFKFTFSCRVEGAENKHIIDFNFSKDNTNLFRITALIGKNGTGKTQILANFARSMSGLVNNAGSFSLNRPSFSKVISISYSAFDQFPRPSDEIDAQIKDVEKEINADISGDVTLLEDRREQLVGQGKRLKKEIDLFSYVYCGMRRKQNYLFSAKEMLSKLDTAFDQVKGLNRQSEWQQILNTLLDNKHENPVYDQQSLRSLYQLSSSGQRILILIITEVVANIEKESIVLFDEPELHLHPEAISSLARALHMLLDKFNSYAIIATHSPILLQEIPSKQVRILRRQGNFAMVDSLEIESFGENLTVITDEVFETAGLHNNYRDHLRNLLREYSQQQILQFFDNRLGFNARAALNALEKTSKREE
jgi:predicted ATPase